MEKIMQKHLLNDCTGFRSHLNYVDLEEQFSVDIGCKKGILYLLATTRIASANSSNQASEPNHKASGSHEKLLIFF